MMREDQTLPERAAPLSRVVDFQQPQIKLAEHEFPLLLNVTSTGEIQQEIDEQVRSPSSLAGDACEREKDHKQTPTESSRALQLARHRAHLSSQRMRCHSIVTSFQASKNVGGSWSTGKVLQRSLLSLSF